MGVIANLLGKIGFKVDTNPLEKVEKQLEGIKSRLEVLGAIEIVKGIFELGEHYSQFAVQLGVAASAAGITVEALQKLQYAAGLAGVGSEEVTTGLGRLTRALYEARQGGAEAQKAFTDIGITSGQLAGFKTSTDALGAIGDRLRTISDPIKKQALTLQLLGRGSANMVEFLEAGQDAMRKTGEAADAMGAVVSTKAIKQLREMEESTGTLWRVTKAFSAGIAAQVAPGISSFAKQMISLYAANKQFLELKIKGWLDKFLFAFGFLTGVVTAITQRFINFAKAHPVLVEKGAEVAATLLAVAIGAMAVSKFFSILEGLFGAIKGAMLLMGKPFSLVLGAFGLFQGLLGNIIWWIGRAAFILFPALGEAIMSIGAIISFTPVGWFAAAVIGLVLAFQALWEVLHGKSIKDTWVGQIFDKGVGVLKSAAQWLGLMKEDAPAAAGAATGAAQPAGPAGFMEQFAAKTNYVQSAPDRAMNTQQQTDARLAQALATQNKVFNINAPIEVNVPPGTDPKMVGDKVREGVQKHLDSVARQTSVAMGGTQAY